MTSRKYFLSACSQPSYNTTLNLVVITTITHTMVPPMFYNYIRVAAFQVVWSFSHGPEFEIAAQSSIQITHHKLEKRKQERENIKFSQINLTQKQEISIWHSCKKLPLVSKVGRLNLQKMLLGGAWLWLCAADSDQMQFLTRKTEIRIRKLGWIGQKKPKTLLLKKETWSLLSSWKIEGWCLNEMMFLCNTKYFS